MQLLSVFVVRTKRAELGSAWTDEGVRPYASYGHTVLLRTDD